MKCALNHTKYSHLFFIMDSCNANRQMLRMNLKCVLNRLVNTVCDHYHPKQKSDCQFGKFLQSENSGENQNTTVKYDDYDSIPVVEYLATSLETLTVYKQGIVCVDLRGRPEKEGAHPEQIWDHKSIGQPWVSRETLNMSSVTYWLKLTRISWQSSSRMKAPEQKSLN